MFSYQVKVNMQLAINFALSPAGGNENTLFHLDKRSHDQPQHWLLAASALGLQFYSAPAEDADRHGGAGTTLV